MSTMVVGSSVGRLFADGSPPVGREGRAISRLTRAASRDLKAGLVARDSVVFNDLFTLGREHGLEVHDSSILKLGLNFLAALPGTVQAPELSMDHDGELLLDWRGNSGAMLTVSLRADGRLSYAARLSSRNVDHGTKEFIEDIPKSIISLVQQVTSC